MAKKTKTKKPLGRVALKQKEILVNLRKSREDGKPMNTTEAAEAAGYSPSYARSGQIKNTQSFQELMAERISQEDIITAEKRQMNSPHLKYDYFPKDMADSDIEILINSNEGYIFKTAHETDSSKRVYYSVPDSVAIGKALDRIHKINKDYDNTITIKGKLDRLSDEEVEGRISGILSGVIGAFAGAGKKEE